jgi:hypothetical protein
MNDREYKNILMKKKGLGFKIQEFGSIDVSSMIDTLESITDEQWLEKDGRQEIHDVHSNTQSLLLIWPSEIILREHIKGEINHKNYDMFNMKEFLESIKPMYQQRFGEGEFYRASITRLKPKSNIERHTDTYYTLLKCRRTHIPLVTNNDIKFLVEGKNHSLKVGKIYELNNALHHSVRNESDEYRIHLILDYVPNNNSL